VPAPTGTSPTTGGTASVELSEELTIEYDLTTTDLTGAALVAHIHAGAVGVPGDIVFPLTKVSDTQFTGETEPLTSDQLTTLFSGGYYLNVHTTTNPAGEIRGQIDDLERVAGQCSCTELARKDFLRCVRSKIKDLTKEEKKSPAARALKKAAKKSSCGLTKSKKTAACCVPPNGLGEIVQGSLCAPVSEKKAEKQCAALGGTVLTGQSCIPTNGCPVPASPSNAFLD
jgi:CHRD domain